MSAPSHFRTSLEPAALERYLVELRARAATIALDDPEGRAFLRVWIAERFRLAFVWVARDVAHALGASRSATRSRDAACKAIAAALIGERMKSGSK